MTLKLYLHPLSSFCWKVLIPLNEANARAPALFYANKLVPYTPSYPNTARYLDRLQKLAFDLREPSERQSPISTWCCTDEARRRPPHLHRRTALQGAAVTRLRRMERPARQGRVVSRAGRALA